VERQFRASGRYFIDWSKNLINNLIISDYQLVINILKSPFRFEKAFFIVFFQDQLSLLKTYADLQGKIHSSVFYPQS
jgi:hypothetical protein